MLDERQEAGDVDIAFQADADGGNDKESMASLQRKETVKQLADPHDDERSGQDPA